jgi:hypothetical protein
MKRITLLLFIASLFLCSSHRILAQKAIITGKIINNQVEEIKIFNKDNCFKSLIDTCGNFKLVAELSHGGFYKYEGNEWATLYITPGDSLHIELDAEYFDETLKFSGKGAAVNNYIITNLILDDLIFEYGTPQIFTKSTDVFLQHMKYVKLL